MVIFEDILAEVEYPFLITHHQLFECTRVVRQLFLRPADKIEIAKRLQKRLAFDRIGSQDRLVANSYLAFLLIFDDSFVAPTATTSPDTSPTVILSPGL